MQTNSPHWAYTVWMLFLLLSCLSSPEPSPPTCASLMEEASPPTTLSEVEDLVQTSRVLVPELAGLHIEMAEIVSDDTFLAANLDLSTLEYAPHLRTYRIQVNPKLLATPPSGAAMVAILVHEFKHVLDYSQMNTSELIEFGIWYGSADIAEYERQTDLFTLENGCGPGLMAFRNWLYAQVSDEVKAEKQRQYYTPAEIQQWLDEQAAP